MRQESRLGKPEGQESCPRSIDGRNQVKQEAGF
jgi:hypothetical protein